MAELQFKHHIATDPTALKFGTAFIDDANLTADTTGAIESIQNISKGGFDQSATGDLSAPGRNLLVFIHGFDNNFENVLTRAAFIQQRFLGSSNAGASTTVIAFSWPSAGTLVSFPIPQAAYLRDQMAAGQSGAHIMSFFVALAPILTAARTSGARIILLAHSMGNWALQSGVESWFTHGHDAAPLFDEVILAAADEQFSSFEFPLPGRLSGLHRPTKRTSIYYSRVDQVLQLSMVVNLGAQRLGQDGPRHRTDQTLFPPDQYRMVDCTDCRDYAFDTPSSHQYYRRSLVVRTDIAGIIAGPAPGGMVGV